MGGYADLCHCPIEFSLNLKDKERAASMLVEKPIGMRITPENTAYLVKYKISGEKWHLPTPGLR